MNTCDNCGNKYEHSFEIRIGGQSLMFDCFECAIERLAPRCAHCKTKIIGHGVEDSDHFYCCAHCARAAGQRGLVDHIEQKSSA